MVKPPCFLLQPYLPSVSRSRPSWAPFLSWVPPFPSPSPSTLPKTPPPRQDPLLLTYQAPLPQESPELSPSPNPPPHPVAPSSPALEAAGGCQDEAGVDQGAPAEVPPLGLNGGQEWEFLPPGLPATHDVHQGGRAWGEGALQLPRFQPHPWGDPGLLPPCSLKGQGPTLPGLVRASLAVRPGPGRFPSLSLESREAGAGARWSLPPEPVPCSWTPAWMGTSGLGQALTSPGGRQ